MKMRRAVQGIEAAEALRERLSRSDFVHRLDAADHDESVAIAHGLWDIAESCLAILDERLPALQNPVVTDDEIEDLLVELREDLRHINYHMGESRFFALALPDKDDSP